MVEAVGDQTEEGDDGDIRIAVVQHFIRIVVDGHAGLEAQPRVVADVHAHDSGVHIDRTHDLRAVLIQIAKNVFGHLAAAILYNLNLFHNACSSFCLGRPYGPHHLIMVL